MSVHGIHTYLYIAQVICIYIYLLISLYIAYIYLCTYRPYRHHRRRGRCWAGTLYIYIFMYLYIAYVYLCIPSLSPPPPLVLGRYFVYIYIYVSVYSIRLYLCIPSLSPPPLPEAVLAGEDYEEIAATQQYTDAARTVAVHCALLHHSTNHAHAHDTYRYLSIQLQ